MAFLSEMQFDLMDMIDEVVNNLFIVDFLLNFVTAIETNGKVEQNLGQIALQYLRGWLIIDLFACFPFDLIQPLIISNEATDSTEEVSQTNNLVRLAKLPRFYRLLRVVRLFRLLKFSHSLNYIFAILHIDKGVGKLVNVLVAVIFIIHMVACAWFWINEQNGFEPDCWVVR